MPENKKTKNKNKQTCIVHEDDIDNNCNWHAWNIQQKLAKRQEELEIGTKIETIHNTALLRLARIVERVLETGGDLMQLWLRWKITSKCWCKKQGSIIMIIIINDQQQKKKICKIVDFAVPADHRIKLKECEKRDKYLELARELKKTMEHEGDRYTNCDWCLWHGN